MKNLLSMGITLAIFGWCLALASPAKAGCLGAGIGDGCIGIPTPSHREYEHRDYDRDNRSVVIEHHHHRHAPPAIVHEHGDED